MFEVMAFLVTIVAGVFAEALGGGFHMSGMGIIVAVATMGAFILRSVRQKR